MTDPSQILVFDRALVRKHRDRAAARFTEHAALFDETGLQLIERFNDIKQKFSSVLELGAHTGNLAQYFVSRGISNVVATDLSPRMLQAAQHRSPPLAGGDRGGVGQASDPSPAKTKDLPRSKSKFLQPLPQGERNTLSYILADEEVLPFAPSSFDLVISNLSSHWVNDLPGSLAQIRKILKPDGFFLASLIGGASLHELRTCLLEAELSVSGGVSPRFSPVLDLQTASGLLQRAGFILPVADSEEITLTYPDMFTLMRDLRGMGETNAHVHRLRHPTKRRVFEEAARFYAEKFALPDGRIPATFEILYLHGTKSE